jgi:hypothetical protein
MPKKWFTRVLLSLPLAGFLAGCAYNYLEKKPDSVVPPVVLCDTVNRYKWAEVEPILNDQGCTGCHNSQVPVLKDQATLKTYISANGQRFKDAINFRGAHPMPKGGSKMPEADIKKLENWICLGMP